MHERDRERDLLLAWRDGDRNAGSELIRAHSRAMHRFFAHKVGNPEVVQELSQRTFAACVSGVDRFRGDSSFRTWLFAIANNVLREHFRERRRGETLDFDNLSVEDLGAGPSTLLGSAQTHHRLLTALRRISVDSQTLLELYYWEELTGPELAKVFDIPVPTVRGRLSKAKLELRAVLDTMDRTNERPPTTETELDDWAREIRKNLHK